MEPAWTRPRGRRAGQRRLLLIYRRRINVGWQRGGTAWELALLLVATNLVYFSTHVFAYSIGDPNVEGKHLPQVAAHHARVAAPMVSAAFLPLVVVLVLEILGADHQRATSVGVITAAGLLVVVGLPGAYLHGVRGWGLALLTVVILAMTTVLVLAKLWLTH